MRVFFRKDDCMGKDLKGKELGKGICQRQNGKYYARFTNRFGKREDIYGSSLKEVKNKLASRKSEDIKEKNVIKPNTTLDEWYEKWMEIYKEPVIRETTQINYAGIYKKHISPLIGKRRISEITKLEITSVLNAAKRDEYQYSTLIKIRSILKDLFYKALSDEFINKDPVKDVKIPMYKPKNAVKSLTREEQKIFFDCAKGTFFYNLFIVAINTGLRPGELFALTEKDIDFNNKMISVSKTLAHQNFEGDEHKSFRIHPPKTQGSYRNVPINMQCEQALIRQIKQKKIVADACKGTGNKEVKDKFKEFDDLLFITKRNTPLCVDTYNFVIKKIIDEVNLILDPLEQIEYFSGHTFRHTFATRCFEANIPPKTVQNYMGHSSLQMTMDLYTDVLEQKKHSDIKKLNELNSMIIDETSELENDCEDNIISFCG